MQQYLQQCLDFHESQERQRNCESDPSVRQVQFVKSTGGLNEFFPINESHVAPATGQSTHTAVHVQPSLHAESDPHAFTRSVEEGRSRAQAILDRFHQQQRHLLQLSGGSDSAPDFSVQDHPIAGSSHLLLPQGIPETIQVLHAPSTSAHDATYPSAVLFVEQRTKGLEREAQHKHRFLLRNLDFVARREQERAQILADNIAASKVREAHVQYQYSLALRERQRILRESAIIAQTSTAAIGSQTRRDVERMKRKSFEHGAADMRDNEPHSRSPTSSVSVYLSGLPVDGTVDETFLRRLFEPYASIQKIHLYRDKVSGQLKGDALISYHPSNDADHANLLSDVCSQVRTVFTDVFQDSYWYDAGRWPRLSCSRQAPPCLSDARGTNWLCR
jgi:RNA recognition motif. (a.k.a. RRM, RBD, or RNP domain)